MTGARRRLAQVEAAAGVGQGAWHREARDGLTLALEAVGPDVGRVEAVRAAFAVFQGAYRPGAGRADMEAAGDALLDRLEAALDGPTYDALLCALALGH